MGILVTYYAGGRRVLRARTGTASPRPARAAPAVKGVAHDPWRIRPARPARPAPVPA